MDGRQHAVPPPPASTRDLSTRSASSSTASPSDGPQTRAAAWSGAPPLKTVSRAASACSRRSAGPSSTPTTERSVRCRGAAERSPRDRSRNRSSSRASTSSSVSDRSRAAASSIASGSPSSARQIRATASALASPTRNPGRTAAARSANSRAAGCGRRRPGAAAGQGASVSPVMPSLSLLVTRIRRSRQAASSRRASAATSATTCSQLSRTSSTRPFGQPGDQPLHGVERTGQRRHQPGLAQAQRVDQRLRDGRAVGRRGKVDEADLILFPSGGLDRQPGLTDSAGPGERDQAPLAEQRADAFEVAVAPHEAGELGRNPASRRLRRARARRAASPGAHRRARGGIDAELLGQRPPRVFEHHGAPRPCGRSRTGPA